jgi:ATP-binding cassette subfamily A (ABC1) protein 5
VTYAIIITIVTMIITFLAWAIQLYHDSNMVYVFLLLWLYGLSVITFSFMLTPFFHKAETAGAVGSIITMLFSFSYLAVELTRSNIIGPEGAVSKVPTWAQWLLSLLSPVALALGIDQVIVKY